MYCLFPCLLPPPPPAQVLDQQRFLKGGLSKLAEAEGTVDGLSRDAEKQRGVLKVKQAEADDALVRIQASMMQVSGRGGRVCVGGGGRRAVLPIYCKLKQTLHMRCKESTSIGVLIPYVSSITHAGL
jgi:hypothetical protein